MKAPVVLHPCQQLVLSGFWILSILIDVYWYLIVLICIYISVMENNVQYLFRCLFAISIFSLVSCLFRSFAHFKKTGLFIFLWLSFQSSLSILDASPLCYMCFANIFCQPVACLFYRAEVFNVNKV